MCCGEKAFLHAKKTLRVSFPQSPPLFSPPASFLFCVAARPPKNKSIKRINFSAGGRATISKQRWAALPASRHPGDILFYCWLAWPEHHGIPAFLTRPLPLCYLKPVHSFAYTVWHWANGCSLGTWVKPLLSRSQGAVSPCETFANSEWVTPVGFDGVGLGSGWSSLRLFDRAS